MPYLLLSVCGAFLSRETGIFCGHYTDDEKSNVENPACNLNLTC